jgi:hypothetical protein
MGKNKMPDSMRRRFKFELEFTDRWVWIKSIDQWDFYRDRDSNRVLRVHKESKAMFLQGEQ